MRVNELFYSIQGEGILAGIPTVFVRLQGCNLKCSWCDTTKAQGEEGGKEMDVDRIVEYVRKRQPLSKQWVCITGGEPLLHVQELYHLVKGLRREGFRITIETNGSYPPPLWFALVDSWAADCKCPSSGQYDTFQIGWTDLRRRDQVKFVVANEKDLDFVTAQLSSKLFVPTVLISPVMNVGMDDFSTAEWPKVTYNVWWLRTVTEYCKEHRLRMSLQLHKIIYGNKMGV